jgi:hypothetical protein
LSNVLVATDMQRCQNGSSGRSFFTVVSIEGANVRLRDSVGYEFSVPRHSLDCDIVKAGRVISGVQKRPDEVGDVVNETTGDRRDFEGASEQIVGWTPGVATGKGFEKK